MGNQHPDAGPGQASASAWGAGAPRGRRQWGPGTAEGTPRSSPPLDLALVSVPARLSALLVPEDLRPSEGHGDLSGLGHTQGRDTRGETPHAASGHAEPVPLAARRPAGPMPALACGPGPEDGKGSQKVGGSHAN